VAKTPVDWKLPAVAVDANFVCRMEYILDLYTLPYFTLFYLILPYDPQKPVICIDEAPYQIQIQANAHSSILPSGTR
jgi:hypothetical protein